MMFLLHQGENVRSKYNLQVGKVHMGRVLEILVPLPLSLWLPSSPWLRGGFRKVPVRGKKQGKRSAPPAPFKGTLAMTQ